MRLFNFSKAFTVLSHYSAALQDEAGRLAERVRDEAGHAKFVFEEQSQYAKVACDDFIDGIVRPNVKKAIDEAGRFVEFVQDEAGRIEFSFEEQRRYAKVAYEEFVDVTVRPKVKQAVDEAGRFVEFVRDEAGRYEFPFEEQRRHAKVVYDELVDASIRPQVKKAVDKAGRFVEFVRDEAGRYEFPFEEQRHNARAAYEEFVDAIVRLKVKKAVDEAGRFVEFVRDEAGHFKSAFEEHRDQAKVVYNDFLDSKLLPNVKRLVDEIIKSRKQQRQPSPVPPVLSLPAPPPIPPPPPPPPATRIVPVYVISGANLVEQSGYLLRHEYQPPTLPPPPALGPKAIEADVYKTHPFQSVEPSVLYGMIGAFFLGLFSILFGVASVIPATRRQLPGKRSKPKSRKSKSRSRSRSAPEPNITSYKATSFSPLLDFVYVQATTAALVFPEYHLYHNHQSFVGHTAVVDSFLSTQDQQWLGDGSMVDESDRLPGRVSSLTGSSDSTYAGSSSSVATPAHASRDNFLVMHEAHATNQVPHPPSVPQSSSLTTNHDFSNKNVSFEIDPALVPLPEPLDDELALEPELELGRQLVPPAPADKALLSPIQETQELLPQSERLEIDPANVPLPEASEDELATSFSEPTLSHPVSDRDTQAKTVATPNSAEGVVASPLSEMGQLSLAAAERPDALGKNAHHVLVELDPRFIPLPDSDSDIETANTTDAVDVSDTRVAISTPNLETAEVPTIPATSDIEILCAATCRLPQTIVEKISTRMSGSNIPSIEDKAGVPHEVPRAVGELEVDEATLDTNGVPSESSNVVVGATPDISEDSPGFRDATDKKRERDLTPSRGMSASIWAPRVGDTAEQSSGRKDVPLTGASQRDPFKSLLNIESARDCQKGGSVTSNWPRNKAEASEQGKGSRDGANVHSASMKTSGPTRNTHKEIPIETSSSQPVGVRGASERSESRLSMRENLSSSISVPAAARRVGSRPGTPQGVFSRPASRRGLTVPQESAPVKPSHRSTCTACLARTCRSSHAASNSDAAT